MRRIRTSLVVLPILLALAGTPIAASEDSGGPATWHAVRFEGRITQADHDALRSAGADALQYAPHGSYLAWMTPGAVERARALPGVADVRPLTAEEKVDPRMDPTGDRRPLVLVTYGRRAAGLAAALSKTHRVAGVRAAQPDGALRDVELLARPGDALALAARPEVLYVGPASPGLAPADEISDQIVAGNVPGFSATPGYEEWLAAAGVDGSGVRVSVVDSGIDPHPDLADRIVAKVEYSESPTGEPLDTLGHGTHVAGIVGGDATGMPPVAERPRDGDGFLYGLGVAPKVELVDQNALATTASFAICAGNPFWPPPYGWQQLTADALANDAGIWNASWWSCEAVGGGYLESSRTMDLLVRDGAWETEGAQPFTMVSAAGNFGSSPETIGSPWEAKNPIIVGATVNARNGGNPRAIAGFSSRGPAADGRVLPTVVAPGQTIVSTRSFAGAVCNLPPGADSYGLYGTCSGTSMATPHVAGSAALITQWWRERSGGSDPSPAMTKALLVNTATDLGRPDVPNQNEGWGRVNLGALFDPSAERVYEDQGVVLTDPGEAATLEIEPADPAVPLRVTLAWTDAPGAPGADPALVNDLNLRVEATDGALFWGNNLAEGRSLPGGAPDTINNVENVFIEQPGGSYSVTVEAANLPGDGVPLSGDETDQDFALVISNAVIAPATP